MTVSIRIQGASFSKFGDIDPSAAPHIADARAFYLLGGDAAESLKNRVPNSPNPTASAIGTPTYGNGYARLTCTETNGIDSGFTFSSQQHTHIIVAARQNASNRLLAGYWKASATKTEAAIGFSNTFDKLVAYMDSSPRAEQPFAPVIGQFAFMATTYDGTNAKAYAHNGSSLLSTSAVYAAGALDTAAPFLVGASGVGTGEFDAAAVMTFNSALSSTELGELYNYFKQLMPLRQVPML
jgi:hypothetical protein